MTDANSAGVIAGGFRAGGLRVEAKALARVLGIQPPRGLQEKRVTDADETEATLAWDALSDLLAQSGVAPKGLAKLFVASQDAAGTAAVLVDVLGDDSLDVVTAPGDAQSSASALATALHQAQTSEGPVAFVAVQATTRYDPSVTVEAAAMMEDGAGAVALLVGADAAVQSTGHKNSHGKRALAQVRKELNGGAEDAAGLSQVAAAVLPEKRRGLERSLGNLPLAPYSADRLGALGAAGPPAALLQMLAQSKPGQQVALLVPDAERVQALTFQVQEVPRVRSPEAALQDPSVQVTGETALHVARTWQENAHAEPRGAYVPYPIFAGQNPARLRLSGQKCLGCSRLLFPPRERCPGCAGADFESHRFKGEGSVYSVTKIGTGGAPGEFAPLQSARGAYGVAVVELAEGPRVAAMLTGPALDGSGVKIGDPVRLVMRLLYVQEGRPRYSFKALPFAP